MINPLLAQVKPSAQQSKASDGTVLEDLAYDQAGQPLATTLHGLPPAHGHRRPQRGNVHLDLAPSPPQSPRSKGRRPRRHRRPRSRLGQRRLPRPRILRSPGPRPTTKPRPYQETHPRLGHGNYWASRLVKSTCHALGCVLTSHAFKLPRQSNTSAGPRKTRKALGPFSAPW